MTAVAAAALAVIAVSSLLLFLYGANLLFFSWRALRPAPGPAAPPPAGAEPLVCVQIPIYDERYVAERVIDAACRLDWPRDRLEVQVLDDSDDSTSEVAASAVRRWRQAGVRVSHVRREGRAGYKAGALAHGLPLTQAPFLAVLDADFLPPPDWLRRVLGAFRDPSTGWVQARWGHLNESYSAFTRAQAVMVDFHFLVEQPVRARLGLFGNFTGSAGVWRRTAVEDAGGWSGRTLTEDLDLSYRAQLRGWRGAYLEEVVVPQELPVAVNGYRAQQSRWARGSFQCAFRLLGPLLTSRLPAAVKLEGAVHLLGYAAPVLMLLQIAAYPLLLLARHGSLESSVRLPLAFSLMSLAPVLGCAVAQHRLGRSWWRRLPAILSWTVVGSGTSAAILLSLLAALRPGGVFRRTPKYRIESEGQEWAGGAYVTAAGPVLLVEVGLGAAAALLVRVALEAGEWLLAAYALLFATGFLTLAGGTLAQGLARLSLRRLGRNLPGRLRRALPAPGLLVLAAVWLGWLAGRPQPFEDPFQHWLIAAHLAQTGHLRDPLFGMEDTWLPAYHVLAALLLKVAGLWRLDLLRLLNVGFGLVTLALVYRLAGSPRRGRFAVALLALNPIFALTATTSVAEPMLVTCLLGAFSAARAGRLKTAAALAGLACLTGTKAWLWLGCLGLVVLLDRVRAPGSVALRRGLAFAAPLVALVALLEAGFGFAAHSATRGAIEVASAAARGSVPASAATRAGEFWQFFALASVPIVVLAPLGLVLVARGGGRRRLLGLHLPSLLYLSCVTALIWSGIYTGSHRYYYPALPALAILAATALDRLPLPVGLGALAAAGVAAFGFLPVLSGLAADNRGLVAAGQAAGAMPGPLLTDSPVAAYWSHKPPSQISGSRNLPAGPEQAIAALQARGVDAVVVEDVDYYRAVRLFPGLAAGRASPPFRPAGDQARFEVPGGKRVYLYELAPGPFQARLGGGLGLDADPARAPARGKSAPLAKGPVLTAGGRDLAGEGMGFGVPIVQYADGWVYPGAAETADLSGPAGMAWRRTFELDLVGGDPAHGHRFERVPARGEVQVTYRVQGGAVRVRVEPLRLAPGWSAITILNEESGLFDDYADGARTLRGTGIGSWTPVSGSWARLRSARLGVEFEIDAPPPGAGYYAGREAKPPLFDWSGLEYSFGPGFQGLDYRIQVRRAR